MATASTHLYILLFEKVLAAFAGDMIYSCIPKPYVLINILMYIFQIKEKNTKHMPTKHDLVSSVSSNKNQS